MTQDQALIFAIIAGTMGLFLWGRLRHDIVALISLIAAVAAGLVPQATAFEGFSQPAVITVACVLILSRALQHTGAVDVLARTVLPRNGGATVAIASLLGLGALLSAFMNNVGAMALLMPVAIRMASRHDLAAGQVLMPLAFATMLGGMTTLIGTPPNLIVSGFRDDAGLGPYEMFDFTSVGLAIAVAGIAFLSLIGRHVVPARNGSDEDFATGAYFTELRVPDGSPIIGKTLREAEEDLHRSGAQIVGLVRNEVYLSVPRGSRDLQAGDVLVVEAELPSLTDSLSTLGLELAEVVKPDPKPDTDAAAATEREPAPETTAEVATEAAPEPAADAEKPRNAEGSEVQLREFVVRPGSMLDGESPASLEMRTRFGVNVLALSRDGLRRTTRMRHMRMEEGDLLLVQGPAEVLSNFAATTGTVALAERSLSIPDRPRAALAGAIMAAAVIATATGLVPTTIAFAAAVVATIVLKTLPLRLMYDAIDWPVIVLLGALIPVAGAMETTGAASLVARTLVEHFAQGNPMIALALVIVVTMTLSDVMNNAATAAVMCPIAIGIAQALGANPDSFLMGVAIGASCAFLTPIGHQNNTLILGPGGFRFGDYWKPGILIELVVFAVAMVMLPIIWPL